MSPTVPACWPPWLRSSAPTACRSARWSRSVWVTKPDSSSSPTWPCRRRPSHHRRPPRARRRRPRRRRSAHRRRSGRRLIDGRLARDHRGVPRSSASDAGHAGGDPARGGHAAAAGAQSCRSVSDARVLLKIEGLNPTGSFKDRGMTLAISKAVEEGAKAVVCASTGNTSASAAAYATARRTHVRRAHPRGSHRPGQAGPSSRPRGQGPAGAGQLRRGSRHRASSG
jgi:hypothetical protein